MAIDTNNEKLALIQYQQPHQCSAPISSDGLGQDDTQQLLWGYPGILWGTASPTDSDAIAYNDSGSETQSVELTDTGALAFSDAAAEAQSVELTDTGALAFSDAAAEVGTATLTDTGAAALTFDDSTAEELAQLYSDSDALAFDDPQGTDRTIADYGSYALTFGGESESLDTGEATKRQWGMGFFGPQA